MFKLFADFVTFNVLNLQKGTHLAESVNFFIYDIPKIYFLLTAVMFVVAIIRTFIQPSKIKQILASRHPIYGNFLAAFLGIFTPFCTCSAIPLFLGMIESGVPLGVAMSFIISSPTINEIALVLLWGIFGWKVALVYVGSGLFIAVTAGYLIGKLKMEKYVEQVSTAKTCYLEESKTWGDRFKYAYEYTLDVFKSVWLYVMIGVGIGALIHGYLPVDFISTYAGKSNPFAVIIAVLVGIPLYANCAGAVPVVQAILEKGLPLGTSLAFMMAVTGLSLPEFIILRKVLKPRLLAVFICIVGLGIILIGYLFNFIF